MSAKRIVVIGDVMIDVVVRPTARVAPTSDTPSHVRFSRGGAAANMAVVLARAGHDVTYIGAVGDDAPGQMVTDDLVNAGVDARLSVVAAPTGVVVALVALDGQRSMMTDRGANQLLDLEAVERHLALPFDHLHVSGYTLLDTATRGVGTAALRRARSDGRPTSVDVCSVGPLADVTPAVFLEAARDATTLFANEEEALALSGAPGVDDAIEQLARHFDEVVVTRGANGARARRGGEHAEVPSLSRDVLDTTGAGDAATGAYLAARLQGGSLVQSLNDAMASAAVVVRGLGSRG